MTSLLLASALAVPAPLPLGEPRLAVEGMGVGDPEGRLITLMPTARCSSVAGAESVAARWCHIPEQRVFGVTPDSLTVTLGNEGVRTIIARVSGRRWALLRATLLKQLGEPQEARLSAPALAGDGEAAEADELLRWVRDGVELVVAPGPGDDTTVTLRRVADAAQ